MEINPKCCHSVIIACIYSTLNSSPIDELGNWCQERLVGGLRKYEAQQGGFHGDPVSGNQRSLRPPALSH